MQATTSACGAGARCLFDPLPSHATLLPPCFQIHAPALAQLPAAARLRTLSGWSAGSRPDALPRLQVPLGARYDPFIDEPLRFNIDMAAEQARQLVAGRSYDAMVPDPRSGALVPGKVPAHVGMVIDLTNSKRYYDPEQWLQQGIKYIKAGQGPSLCHRKGAAWAAGGALRAENECAGFIADGASPARPGREQHIT